MSFSTLKYRDLDPDTRDRLRHEWNQPVTLAGLGDRGRGCGRVRPGVATVLRAALMLAYLVRRTLFGAATVLGVLLFLFVLFFLVTAPEDIARKSIGEKAQPEAIAQWLGNHGYDKPLFWNAEHPADTLLVDHFRRMLTFDFGVSDADGVPITRRLARASGRACR
jgi:hypothetical protein